MKLFHKIFLCFIVIFGITFQLTGYLLINFAFGNAMEQEKKTAFQEFQYNKYILQSILYARPDFFLNKEMNVTEIGGSFTAPVAVCMADGEYVFSNMTALPDNIAFAEGEDDRISFQIYGKEEKSYIFVCAYVGERGKGMFLVTQTDISSVVGAQKSMAAYFQKIYIAVFCISFPVIFLLTKAVTASIQKVGKAAERIAGGAYSERIVTKGKDEIGELASGFNKMAEQVEEKIAELSDIARQKEDFAANFAHELKTPLTSVIGYADMLCQHQMSREEVKSAAGYILDEGMRLESLSLKLMDLFVLNRQDFLLEEMPVNEMFQNLEQGLEPVCRKHGVALHTAIGEGSIRADYDLFKTMILNLADNAIKADCKDLWLNGEQHGSQYRLAVRDNGKGIPPEELGKITEAFYMVDKSRSRKQHGAGLGLALASRIVEIHRAEMEIASDGRTGTAVSIVFCLQEEYRDEENK